MVDRNVNRARAIYQVSDINNNEPNDSSAGPDAVQNLVRRPLPSPDETAQQAASAPSDYELLAQHLLSTAPPAVSGSSGATDIEQLLRRLLPVTSVAEETIRPDAERRESTRECFSCGSKDHTAPGCQALKNHFRFCRQAGRRIEKTTNLCCDRPRRETTTLRREMLPDPGRGVGLPDQ